MYALSWPMYTSSWYLYTLPEALYKKMVVVWKIIVVWKKTLVKNQSLYNFKTLDFKTKKAVCFAPVFAPAPPMLPNAPAVFSPPSKPLFFPRSMPVKKGFLFFQPLAHKKAFFYSHCFPNQKNNRFPKLKPPPKLYLHNGALWVKP